MKINKFFVFMIILFSLSFTGCKKNNENQHVHSWIDATCTVAKHCATCSQVEGSPLGHNENEVTCETAGYCLECGEILTTPLGHDWIEATYENPKTCSVCGETYGKKLAANLEVQFDTNLYVEEVGTFVVTSSYEKDDVVINNKNTDIIEIVNDKIVAKQVGVAYIDIISKTGSIKQVVVEVINRPAPTSLELYIEEEGPYLLGMSYQLKYKVYPEDSDSTVFFNYQKNEIDFNKETQQLVFKKAGTYCITCYSDIDIDVFHTLEVEVDFNPEIETYDMLFMGNSLTKYTYNIPDMIKNMMLNDGVVVNCTVNSPSGFYLIDSEIKFNLLIKERRYTHVILQEQSFGPIGQYDKFESTVLKYNELIKENKAKLVLYQTWAYNVDTYNGLTKAEFYQGLIDGYEKVAKKTNAIVTRAGEGFRLFEALYGNTISLYDDMNHPSLFGAYLSACIHYVTLTGRKASLNEYAPEGIDQSTKEMIQKVADTFCITK